nr:MAG TPA: hypothetical protein [Caudoviricetes sp.]
MVLTLTASGADSALPQLFPTCFRVIPAGCVV